MLSEVNLVGFAIPSVAFNPSPFSAIKNELCSISGVNGAK